MRNFGFILLFGGILGFIYCMTQASAVAPLPEGLALSDYLRHPAGRLELGKYAAALAMFVGALLALFPKEGDDMVRTPRAIGVQLMGIWLLIWGLNVFIGIPGLTTLLALFAIVAGLLILAGR